MRLTADQQALVAGKLDLAYGLAWRLASEPVRRRWMAEVRGAAALGLCHAVATHDPAGGRQLGPWIWLRVRGAVVDELRNIERYERWDNALASLNR